MGCFLGVAATVGLVFGGMHLGNYIVSFWIETFELKGDPAHFDPITSLGEIRSHFDAHAKLSSLRLQYVRSDGTMDLTAGYKPTATYTFYRELTEPPKNAPPVGAGGTSNGKWYEPVTAEVYEPGQWRHVESNNSEYNYMNKGIELDRSTATHLPSAFVEDPHCSIAEFWKVAIEKGAPSEAVATITYGERGYDFRIIQTSIGLQFGHDCQLKP